MIKLSKVWKSARVSLELSKHELKIACNKAIKGDIASISFVGLSTLELAHLICDPSILGVAALPGLKILYGAYKGRKLLKLFKFKETRKAAKIALAAYWYWLNS